jgi:hypothetical protein
VDSEKGGTRGLSTVSKHFPILAQEMGNNPKVLACPADSTKDPASNYADMQDANVSYFIGLDSDESSPGTIVVGDRNISLVGGGARPTEMCDKANVNASVVQGFFNTWGEDIHRNMGNIGLSDGSVQLTRKNGLNEQLRNTGLCCSSHHILLP